MSFLKTSGTSFTLDGNRFPLFGCTIYDSLYFPNLLPAKFDLCVSYGYNTIRFTNFMNGSNAYSEPTYVIIDYALDECRKRGLKVIFEMTDILTINGQAGGNHSTSQGLADVYALYNSFLAWLSARVNTVNGRTYANDDTICILQPVSEAGDEFYPAPTGNRDFFATVCGYVRSYFPNHIVQPGGQKPEQIVDSSYGLSNFVGEDVLSLSSVDACSTEPYYTQQNILDLFPVLQDYSQKRNKPWFCVEFGFNQSVSQVRPDRNRAQLMRFVYQNGLKYGCAGFIFWNFDNGYYNEQTQTGGGYGINANTPETLRMVKRYSKYNGHSVRIPVTAAEFGGT